MNDGFYEADGTPKQGVVPTRVRFVGDGDFGPVRGAANQLVGAFLSEVRLGGLQQCVKEFVLGDGSSITMTHMFGVTEVVLRSSARAGKPLPEVGGIVLRPTVLDNGVEYVGVHPFQETFYPMSTPADAKTSGKSASKPGRPAFVVNGEGETNQLVVYIRGDRPLGPTPIADKNVVIRRAKDLQTGKVFQTQRNVQFALSADQDFEEFYYLGQKVLNIPPVVFPDPEYIDRGISAALYTHRFSARDYKNAATPTGVVIVVAKASLHVLDTREGVWHLLADHTADSVQAPNDYGYELQVEKTQSGAAEVVTLTTVGTNNAGPCSVATVVITTIGSTRTFSGSLQIVDTAVSPGANFTDSNTAITHTYTGLTPFKHYSYPLISWQYTNEGPPDFALVVSGRSDQIISAFNSGYDASYSQTSQFQRRVLSPTAPNKYSGAVVTEEDNNYITNLTIAADMAAGGGLAPTSYGSGWQSFKGSQGLFTYPSADKSSTSVLVPRDAIWLGTVPGGALGVPPGFALLFDAVRSADITITSSTPRYSYSLSLALATSTLNGRHGASSSFAYGKNSSEADLFSPDVQNTLSGNVPTRTFSISPASAEPYTVFGGDVTRKLYWYGRSNQELSVASTPDCQPVYAPDGFLLAGRDPDLYLAHMTEGVLAPTLDLYKADGTKAIELVNPVSTIFGAAASDGMLQALEFDVAFPSYVELPAIDLVMSGEDHGYVPEEQSAPPPIVPPNYSFAESEHTEGGGWSNAYGVPAPRTESLHADVLRDPRTGGFITALDWPLDVLTGPGQRFVRGFKAYIGNDFGAMPLDDVLQEWRALGETSGEYRSYFFAPDAMRLI